MKQKLNHLATDGASAPNGHRAAEDASPLWFEPANFEEVERLCLHEQYRLIEIAHETGHSEIRKAALQLLDQYLNPLMITKSSKDSTIT